MPFAAPQRVKGDIEMERITNHAPDSTNENKIGCTSFRFPVCRERMGVCDGCPVNEAAWSRLAAYEDTGLFPGEVAKMLVHLAGDKLETVKRLQQRIHDQRRDNRRLQAERNLAVKALNDIIKAKDYPPICLYCRYYNPLANEICPRIAADFKCWAWKGAHDEQENNNNQ